MQEDPSLTRAGKRFRGNSENMKHYQGIHRAKTPKRLSERLRKTPVLLLESSTQTTSPPKLNTSDGSSLGGCLQTPHILGGGQANPISAQPQQTHSSSAQP